jgi:hypothetical protein
MSNEKQQQVVYRVVSEGEPVQFQAQDSHGTVRRPAPCDGLWGRAGDSLFWIPLEALRHDISTFDLQQRGKREAAAVAGEAKLKTLMAAKKEKPRGKR